MGQELEARAELREEVFDHVVVPGTDDPGVEREVRLREGEQVAVVLGDHLLGDEVVEVVRDVVGQGVPVEGADRGRLEHDPDREEVRDLLVRDRGDDRSPLGEQREQAARLELEERLADGGATDAELVGDLPLGDERPGGRLARDDRGGHRGEGALDGAGGLVVGLPARRHLATIAS